MTHVTGAQVLNYGCDDAICTANNWHMFDLILTLEQTRVFTYENYFDAAHPLLDSFEQGENIDFVRLKELEEEDAETIQEADALIRSHLSEHCTEEDRTAANNSLAEDYEYFALKWREAKKDREGSSVRSEEHTSELQSR